MEQKPQTQTQTQTPTQADIRKIAEKIFRGEPLSTDEAMMLTNAEICYAVSVQVWNLCIASV